MIALTTACNSCSLLPGTRLQRPAMPRAAPCRRRHAARRTAAAAIDVRAAHKQVYSSFQDMIEQSPQPVLVEFHATWCGPCQMMSGILDEVAPSMRHKVKFVKVDTEKYPVVASKYRIGALPTLVLFKDGQPVDRVEGVLYAPDLRSRLEYLCR